MIKSSVFISGIDTSALPKLKEDEQVKLFSRLKEGDLTAREKLAVGNLRLVLAVLKRFARKNAASDDLFQAGCVGLMKAIDNFDVAVGVRFSSYGVPMIIGEIKKLLREGNSLRVARSIRDTAYAALSVRCEMEKNSEEVSFEKIAEKMNVAAAEVVYALDAISDVTSIYEPVYNKNGDELLLLDQIGDEKEGDEKWTENVAIKTAISSLPEREKTIIYLRYFEGKTQTEISREVGISQAQISRLEKNALKEIKSAVSL